MLTDYIQAALRHAHYEFIDGPKPYYGAIPNCPGVWATAESLEACREELQSVLEDWIVLGLRLGHPIPSLTTEPFLISLPLCALSVLRV